MKNNIFPLILIFIATGLSEWAKASEYAEKYFSEVCGIVNPQTNDNVTFQFPEYRFWSELKRVSGTISASKPPLSVWMAPRYSNGATVVHELALDQYFLALSYSNKNSLGDPEVSKPSDECNHKRVTKRWEWFKARIEVIHPFVQSLIQNEIGLDVKPGDEVDVQCENVIREYSTKGCYAGGGSFGY